MSTRTAIPTDVGGILEFWKSLKVELSAIDRSTEDLLTRWVDVPRTLLGHPSTALRTLHYNSLHRLDRYLGKLVLEKGAKHASFSVKFHSYVRKCRLHHVSPKGKVI